MTFTPAVGQGAIALQTRADDKELLEILSAIDHAETRAAVTAERAFLRAMGGGCRTPMGAYGIVRDGGLSVSGMASSVDGTQCFRASVEGAASEAEALGDALARLLLEDGASALLAEDAA